MRVIDSWTGGRADALREAFRMTIEDFAEKLGISPRAVAYWRQRPGMVQRPERQRILDTALDRAPDPVKIRFAMLVDQNRSTLITPIGSGPAIQQPGVAGSFQPPMVLDGTSIADARNVIQWVESTNTSDDIISYFAQAVTRIAEEHAAHPPVMLLAKVQQLHAMIQALLRSGKQRHRQVGDLLRLDSDLLAHLCQLLGDVHRDQAASAYAEASIALGDEAGSGSAAAFSAQSQLARWRGRYAEAADLAAKGLGGNPHPALRTLLAYQEADAAAASGQMRRRASVALQRADAMDDGATSYSAWSCPPARRALFRMGVALNLGDPREALRQAGEAESMWEREKPLAFGTWAHFQIAAAKAHIMLHSPDGAMQQVVPVLVLPHEYRISTLAGHVATLDALLLDRRFDKSRQVASLRVQLARFTQRTADKEDE
jgi:hypothetical protein